VAKLGVAHADARVQDNYLHVPTAQALHTPPHEPLSDPFKAPQPSGSLHGHLCVVRTR
jgi:hypothetical protein